MAKAEPPSDCLFIGGLPREISDAMLLSVFGAYGKIKSSKLLPPGGMQQARAAIISFESMDEAKWLVENLNGNIPQGLSKPIVVKYKSGGPTRGPGNDAGHGKGGAWVGKQGGGAQPDAKAQGAKGGKPPWGGDSGKAGDGHGSGEASWGGEGATTPDDVSGGDASSWTGEGGSSEPPSDTLHIGNLPASLDEQTFRSVFDAYGTIKSVRMLAPTASGTRAAILQLASVTEATWLVENLDGNLPQGLTGTDSIEVKYRSAGKADKGKAQIGSCGGKSAAAAQDEARSNAPWGGKNAGAAQDDGRHSGAWGGKTSGASHDEGKSWGGKAGGKSSWDGDGRGGGKSSWAGETDSGAAAWDSGDSGGSSWDDDARQSGAWGGKNGGASQHEGKSCGGKAGGKSSSEVFRSGGCKPPGAGETHSGAAAWDGGDSGGSSWDDDASGETSAPSEHLLVGNLPASLDENTFRSVFGPYGTVKSLRLLPPTAAGVRSAVVQFAALDEAKWICENLDGNLPQGLTGTDALEVRFTSASYGKAEKAADKGKAQGRSGPYGGEKGAAQRNEGKAWGAKATGASQWAGEESGDRKAQWGSDDKGAEAPWATEDRSSGAAWDEEAGEGDDPMGGEGNADDATANGGEAPSDTLYVGNLPAYLDERTFRGVFGPYGAIKSLRMLTPSSGKRAAIVEFTNVDEATWIVENLDGNLPQGLTGTDSIEAKFHNQSTYGKADKGKAHKGEAQKGEAQKGEAQKGGSCSSGPYAGGKESSKPAAGKGEGGKAYSGKAEDDSANDNGVKPTSVRTLIDGLVASGAMPGGKHYSNDANTLFVGGLPHDTTDFDLFEMFSSFGAIACNGVKAMMEGTKCKGFGFINFLDSSSTDAAVAALNGAVMPDGKTLTVSIKRSDKSGKKGGTKCGGGAMMGAFKGNRKAW